MTLLVRTWNVFHGNTKPPQRRAFLAEMVRLVAADDPDVVCLQEVPVWAVEFLDEWSGMIAFAEVAAPPTLGPLPSSARIGRRVTSLHHGLFRSGFTGQANAILVAARLAPRDHRMCILNSWRFRRAQARWLRLGVVPRLGWAKERRVCHAVRVQLGDTRTAVVGNMHATSFPADERLADAELLRGATFLDAAAEPGEVCVLAGDLNVKPERSRTLTDLAGPEWGFSRPRPGIDQVLVRGAAASRAHRWPDERRRLDGRLLSDHAPVEVRLG